MIGFFLETAGTNLNRLIRLGAAWRRSADLGPPGSTGRGFSATPRL